MKLIGMLDSPYVRRVAISLRLQQIAFKHQPLSVFSDFDAFTKINSSVKAPTLLTDDGIVLMDSTLILEYAERVASSGTSLSPREVHIYPRAQRVIGLALVACEKTVQIVYERHLRPPEKQHQPWLERVHSQLIAAYRALEAEFDRADPWLFAKQPLQPDITSAVAFRFTQEMLPRAVNADVYPNLAALSQRAEATEAFREFPFG